MKKLLAMLLALVMCLSMFAACGDKADDKDEGEDKEAIEELEKEIDELKEELEDEDDEDKIKELEEKIAKKEKELKKLKGDKDDKDEEEEDAKGGDILAYLSDLGKVKVTATFDDIENLEKYTDMLGSDEGIEIIDVKDGKAELYLDTDKEKLAILGSAKLDGDKHELGFYIEDGAMIFDSEVIDGAAGIDEDVSMESMAGAFKMINKFADGSLTGAYAEKFGDILLDVADAKEDDDGDNRVISFELDTEDMVAVGEELIDFFAEEGFGEYMYPIASDLVYVTDDYGWYIKEGEKYPYDRFYEGEIVFDDDGNLVGADIVYGYSRVDEYDGSSYGSEETVTYEYDPKTDKFEYTTDYKWFNNGEASSDTDTTKISGTVGKSYVVEDEYGWSYTENGYELPYLRTEKLTVEIGKSKIDLGFINEYSRSEYDYSSGKVVEKSNSNELNASAKYSISGKTLTVTPLSFSVDDIEIEDIDKDFGIKVEIEKGAKMVSAPDYEEYDEDDWGDFYEDVTSRITDEYGYIFDFIDDLFGGGSETSNVATAAAEW
ncbi:MAG: hypothetical protein IJC81_05475 [Clostridia bacterium]|nr:hypothetical protein [Clostridia bacterium]